MLKKLCGFIGAIVLIAAIAVGAFSLRIKILKFIYKAKQPELLTNGKKVQAIKTWCG